MLVSDDDALAQIPLVLPLVQSGGLGSRIASQTPKPPRSEAAFAFPPLPIAHVETPPRGTASKMREAEDERFRRGHRTGAGHIAGKITPEANGG
jgi:hypothetical protein